MNFRDPDLILIKKFRGGKCSFFQVKGHDQQKVILQDIEHGGNFTFQRRQLESHIRNGVLTVSDKSEIPISTFAYAFAKKVKVAYSDTLINDQEVERRYRYVRKVLDSELPSLSEQRLKPWIAEVAAEFEDDSPPSYKSLGRWVKAFTESGWKKSALAPTHQSKGNSTQRLCTEVEQILNQVVSEHATSSIRVNVAKAHHDFVERIISVNRERSCEGLAPLTPSSYQTTLKRFRK